MAINCRNSMRPTAKDEHCTLKSDSDRMPWLAQYTIGPEQATTKGFVRTTAFNTVKQDDDAAWLHESQIAGPAYLNDAIAAKVLTNSGELESRPSESPSFVAEGLKQ